MKYIMSPFGESFLELLANNYSNDWRVTKKDKKEVLYKLRFMNNLFREHLAQQDILTKNKESDGQ